MSVPWVSTITIGIAKELANWRAKISCIGFCEDINWAQRQANDDDSLSCPRTLQYCFNRAAHKVLQKIP